MSGCCGRTGRCGSARAIASERAIAWPWRGNSGNTTLPHLHLQVQTHADIWDPDNRSVPFGFEPDGRVLARTGRVGTPVR